MRSVDVIVVGGGIVGCATAYQLMQSRGKLSIVVLEKEHEIAAHQTGRNSGVIHSGVYYKPGSYKATNCIAGKALLEDFCRKRGVPFEICGKVIVAIDESDASALENIWRRGTENGVPCRQIDNRELKRLEPHVNGVAGLHVTSTGIVDYRQVSRALVRALRDAGNVVSLGVKVERIIPEETGVVVETAEQSLRARVVVNCGGLFSDRIARDCGLETSFTIVPFRGEYFDFVPSARGFCKNLIYPVPDPAYPFLGVHATRMVDGGVEAGPNAVLAFGREAYDKLDTNLFDLKEMFTFPGFWSFSKKHWRTGIREFWRSWNKEVFVKSVQRLIPEIRSEHLVRGRAGIRAQLMRKDGTLVDDFVYEKTGPVLHIMNAASPAATASLEIGRQIAALADL